MKKFMAFYMASPADFEKMMKSTTPEQQKKGMEEWGKWMEHHKKHIADMGAPLGKTHRVDAKGSKAHNNGIGGYTVVQAESHEAASKLFGKDHPHFKMMPGAWIEITEVMPMPGM